MVGQPPELTPKAVFGMIPCELPNNSFDFMDSTWELFHHNHVQIETMVIQFECLDDFKIGELSHLDYIKWIYLLCQRKN